MRIEHATDGSAAADVSDRNAEGAPRGVKYLHASMDIRPADGGGSSAATAGRGGAGRGGGTPRKSRPRSEYGVSPAAHVTATGKPPSPRPTGPPKPGSGRCCNTAAINSRGLSAPSSAKHDGDRRAISHRSALLGGVCPSTNHSRSHPVRPQLPRAKLLATSVRTDDDDEWRITPQSARQPARQPVSQSANLPICQSASQPAGPRQLASNHCAVRQPCSRVLPCLALPWRVCVACLLAACVAPPPSEKLHFLGCAAGWLCSHLSMRTGQRCILSRPAAPADCGLERNPSTGRLSFVVSQRCLSRPFPAPQPLPPPLAKKKTKR